MSNNVKTQAFAIFAAALMTVAVFSGTGVLAGHQARVVADNITLDRDVNTSVAMEVQQVTIVGHRHHA
jgi:uncharacterized protein (DUF1015 family)